MVKLKSKEQNSTYTRVINEVVSQEGWTLSSLSNETPILVVFLRHLGCIYCRESLSELRRLRAQIESKGVRIALVHMGSDGEAQNLLNAFELDDLIRFSDPEQRLYDAFGLERTTMSRLLAPNSVVSMIKAGIRSETPLRRAMGRVVGDALQMPGVFLLQKGQITDDYRPENLSERPDYLELAALEC